MPFAEAAKRRGIKVYHLNIGQPDIRTPQVAVDAVKNIHDQVFEYGHSAGNESYRRKLADYYRGVGIDVTTDDMVITVGGSEAIFMAMTICLNPGDEVLVPEPFYANYNGFAMEAGVNIKPISSTIANDFALPPMEEFERLITTRTKAILICNPNNPTGYVYSEQEYEQLKNIVLKHDLYLMADEVYREFCYDGTKCISVMNLKGVEQNVVMIDSVSKRYSMCGVRLGTLVSRNRRIIDAALKMGQARLCPPYLAQVAAEAALGAPRSYFEEVHDEYAARRNCIIEALNKIEGVYTPMPKGSFYSIVKLPIDQQRALRAVAARGVRVRRTDGHGRPGYGLLCLVLSGTRRNPHRLCNQPPRSARRSQVPRRGAQGIPGPHDRTVIRHAPTSAASCNSRFRAAVFYRGYAP